MNSWRTPVPGAGADHRGGAGLVLNLGAYQAFGDGAVAAGSRPLRIETATRGEWEAFESGLAAELEEWLLANPDHPEAAAVRDKLDAQRAVWLRGHRDVLGVACLTLGRPGTRRPS